MLFYKIKSLQRRLIAKKYGFLASLYLTANPFVLANTEALIKKEKNLIFLKSLGKKIPKIISFIFLIIIIYFIVTFILDIFSLYFKSFYENSDLDKQYGLKFLEVVSICINKYIFY